MDQFGITERVIDFSIDRISGFIKPNAAERAAAFELLVELSTRSTVAPLAPDEGLLREALSSIYLVFGETRELLRRHGTEVAKERTDGNLSLGVLAMRVLNDVLRPTLSKWHPRLEAYEAGRPAAVGKADWERRWTDADQCRKELNALRESVRAYIDTLGRVAGAPALAEAALPLPPSRALGQQAVGAGDARTRHGDRHRKHMVRWFDLRELAALFRANRRQGTVSCLDSRRCIPIPAHGEDFWFDYVADLGDAFDPTMAVAWQIGRKSITLPADRTGELPAPPDALPRADLLLFGGDTVYPSASAERYRQQLVLPYRLAWEGAGADRPPSVLAIPGNHDWLGGIGHFESLFAAKDAVFAEHWTAPQEAPWFAAQLPRRWWVWGIDTETDNTISYEQRTYFETAAKEVKPGDRVILCTPVPFWQLRQRKPKQYFQLRSFFDGLVRGAGATLPLFLSGDSHYFAHYRRADGLVEEHHVTAGGGGAFLHPTHNLPERIPYERGQAEFALTRRWPSAADSRALAFSWRDLFSRQFLWLLPVVYLLHVAYGALIAIDATFVDRPAAPEAGWRGALEWVLSSWPGGLLLIALVLTGVLATRPNSQESLLVRGARTWGALQGLGQACVFVAAAALGRGLDWDWAWWYVVEIPVLGAAVSIVTFMLSMSFVNNRIKAADNEVFSAVHSRRYKHFLRLRIDAEGRLTLFVIGLDPVGRKWFEALREGTAEPRLVPPYDPDGGPRMHYVWGTTIDGPPSEETGKEDDGTDGDTATPIPAVTAGGRSRPLTVYIAWHPGDSGSATIGKEVLTALQGDPARPAAERIGIPVRFRTACDDSSGRAPTPAPLPIDKASPAVVAVVAGAELLADESWRAWTRALRIEIERLQAEGADVRLVALATSSEALGASDVFGTISALRLTHLSEEARTRTALISVLAAAADLLVSSTAERLRIFISHAKVDGAALAERIDQRIANAKLKAFLDSHDIVEGLPFDKVINTATNKPDGAAIAVVTDAYAGREWCRAEALVVKQADVPIVALDAMRSGQERTLPYLGNVPSVRLGDDVEETLDRVLIALLGEVVRSRWFPNHVARLGGNPGDVMVMSRPPELLTVLHQLRSKGKVGSIMYPDPPLTIDELAVLEEAVKPLAAGWYAGGAPVVQPRFVTPTTVRWKAAHG